MEVDVEKAGKAAEKVIRAAGPVVALLLLLIVCATLLLYAHPELSVFFGNVLGSVFNDKTAPHWEMVVMVVLLYTTFRSRISTLERVIDDQQSEIDGVHDENDLCERKMSAIKEVFVQKIAALMPRRHQTQAVVDIRRDIKIAEDGALLTFTRRRGGHMPGGKRKADNR